jgi:hypothetical protein
MYGIVQRIFCWATSDYSVSKGPVAKVSGIGGLSLPILYPPSMVSRVYLLDSCKLGFSFLVGNAPRMEDSNPPFIYISWRLAASILYCQAHGNIHGKQHPVVS